MASASDQVVGDAPPPSNNSIATDRKRRMSESSDGENKKRKLSGSSDVDMSSVSLLPQPDLPTFNLTSSSRHNANATSEQPSSSKDQDDGGEWQVVENGRAKKNLKKIPKKNSGNYPEFEFSKSSRLQSQIKISDLQSLVLYILADGGAPQFVAVRHRPHIRKVVVLMIPGLEHSMFEKEDTPKNKLRSMQFSSPDGYYPSKLVEEDLPLEMKPIADMFDLLWPVKTPGDDRLGKMHSPLHAMLTAPLPKEKDDKSNGRSNNKKGARPARAPPGWKNVRTPITTFIHTPDELLENEYVVHPASYAVDAEKKAWALHRQSKGTSQDHGWVDSLVLSWDEGDVPENEIEAGSLTAGREILAMDCEMCMTGEGDFSLTRISILGWDGSVIMDELVKPAKSITNYLTQ